MSIIVIALVTWITIFFLLKLIDLLSDRRLSRYLRSNSISLKFAFISIHTTKFNHFLESQSRRRNILLTHWFSAGVPIAAAGLLLSLVLLSVNLVPSSLTSTPIPVPIVQAHFRYRPRVPFMHDAAAPWWLPNPAWNLFVAADHHPSDVHFTNHQTRPLRTVTRPRLGRILYVPHVLHRRRPLQTHYRRRPDRRRNNAQRKNQSFLTPLIPGVTIPAGDFWYMIVAISFAAVLHELGHALAAGAHNARISAVGAFLALAVPGAYVRINGLDNLSPIAQLRVYCAGVWHNVVSAMVALATVLLLPMFMSGAYKRGHGALVVDVPRLSPLHGHLQPGDIILGMGRFSVIDGGPSFRGAIASLIHANDSVGFCVSSNVLRDMANPSNHCCEHTFLHASQRSGRTQCFQEQDRAHSTLCLDPAVVSSRPTCRRTSDCDSAHVEINDHPVRAMSAAYSNTGSKRIRSSRTQNARKERTGTKPLPHHDEKCIIPVLPKDQQLIDVRVRSVQSGETVHFFYEGFPQILGQSVTVSSYVPRMWDRMPWWWTRVVAAVDVPNKLERLLQYFSSISLGLAIINMAPVLYFDGEASSGLFVELFVRKFGFPSNKISKARAGMITMGSGLVVLNLFKAIWSLGL